ncbi:DUF1540 domain-containing protein [Bacillus sp. Bos-x628]
MAQNVLCEVNSCRFWTENNCTPLQLKLAKTQ